MISTASQLCSSNLPYSVIEKRAAESCSTILYDHGDKAFIFPDGSCLEMLENGNINSYPSLHDLQES